MELIKPTRRSLITGLASFICAPAIVRATSLMPVKAMLEEPIEDVLDLRWSAETKSYLDRIAQRIQQALLYGNPEFAPTEFSGFMVRASEP